jgi:hypothetical protein
MLPDVRFGHGEPEERSAPDPAGSPEGVPEAAAAQSPDEDAGLQAVALSHTRSTDELG